MAEMFEMCLHTGKFWAAAKKCDDVWSAWAAGSTSGRGFGDDSWAGEAGCVWFRDPLRNFIGEGRGGGVGEGGCLVFRLCDLKKF
jgi:hypothetical protein